MTFKTWFEKNRNVIIVSVAVGAVAVVALLATVSIWGPVVWAAGQTIWYGLGGVASLVVSAVGKAISSKDPTVQEFNEMDLATLQSQSIDSLLQVVNGKPLVNWLDQSRIQMLSTSQLTASDT